MSSTFTSAWPDAQRRIKLREQHYERIEIEHLERELSEHTPKAERLKKVVFWNLAPLTYILGFGVGMLFSPLIFLGGSILTLAMVSATFLYLYTKKRKFLNRLDTWESRAGKKRFDLRVVIVAVYS